MPPCRGASCGGRAERKQAGVGRLGVSKRAAVAPRLDFGVEVRVGRVAEASLPRPPTARTDDRKANGNEPRMTRITGIGEESPCFHSCNLCHSSFVCLNQTRGAWPTWDSEEPGRESGSRRVSARGPRADRRKRAFRCRRGFVLDRIHPVRPDTSAANPAGKSRNSPEPRGISRIALRPGNDRLNPGFERGQPLIARTRDRSDS